MFTTAEPNKKEENKPQPNRTPNNNNKKKIDEANGRQLSSGAGRILKKEPGLPGIKMLTVDSARYTQQLGSVGSRRSTTRSDPVGNVHKLFFNFFYYYFPPLSPSGLLSSSRPQRRSWAGEPTTTTRWAKKIKVHQINTPDRTFLLFWLLFLLFIFRRRYSIGVVKKPEIDSSRRELLTPRDHSDSR